MANREKSINELKMIENIDLVEYYNTQIVPLGKIFKPVVDSYGSSGICPFHKDTDPSFHVWKQKGIYHCFGCGYGGDVVKSHMQLRKNYYGETLTVEKAVEHLSMIFGIELEQGGSIARSVFEVARERLMDKSRLVTPAGTVTLTDFRKFNKRLATSSQSPTARAVNYAQLDLMMSVAVSNIK